MSRPPPSPTPSVLSERSVAGTPRQNATLLPQPTVPSSPASKQRARELLRKHYGIGARDRAVSQPLAAPGENAAPIIGRAVSANGIPERSSDPLDIDSPLFDARAYYQQLVSFAPLTTLLKHENQLLSEIKQLDSDRQALVYNHHRDLIEASDTIGAMKRRAETLDADMDKLRAAFSEISRIGAELGASPAL